VTVRARLRKIGGVIGWLLCLAALAALGWELARYWNAGAYQSIPFAEPWSMIHANSLVGFGAFVEKSISPALWSDVIVPILVLPAWLVLGVPGGLLLAFRRFRRRRRRRRRRRG
jgi:hypothetical protein